MLQKLYKIQSYLSVHYESYRLLEEIIFIIIGFCILFLFAILLLFFELYQIIIKRLKELK